VGMKLPFAEQCVAAGLPRPLPEEPVIDGRKWRFDFSWPDYKVAVELQGGTHTQGRHTRGSGYERDVEKLNEAQLAGWLVIWTTTRQAERGDALVWAERALRLRGWTPEEDERCH
jgi:very-short-patch-repair endonuclease